MYHSHCEELIFRTKTYFPYCSLYISSGTDMKNLVQRFRAGDHFPHSHILNALVNSETGKRSKMLTLLQSGLTYDHHGVIVFEKYCALLMSKSRD